MRDPRIDNLAKVIVGYSLRLLRQQRVLIFGPETAQAVLLAIYREALDVGALPTLWPSLTGAPPIFFAHADEGQLRYLSPALLDAVNQTDALVTIDAPANLKALAEVPPERQIMHQQARKPLSEAMLRKRWLLTAFPTNALAQQAEMSLSAYEDFYFNAVLRDWPALRSQMQRWAATLGAGHELRIVGSNTDLTMQISGRRWIVAAGEHNLPDGEVFTSPIEDSVNGVITYEYPALHAGHEVENVRLEFEHGQIVEATASRGEAYLLEALNADPGARRVGEIGIGLNYGIDRYTKSVLFDEKIGGTIHVAIGRSFAEAGGLNQSAIHWDMVKDLRPGGAIYLDGTMIQQDGKMLI